MEVLSQSSNNVSNEKKEYLLSKLLQRKSECPANTVHNLNEAPLTSSQKRIWFLQNSEKNYTAMNVMAAFKLKGWLDSKSLKKAIEVVYKRQEALDAKFKVVKGEILQFKSGNKIDEVFFQIKIFSGKIDEYIQKEQDVIFDLEKGPLVRFVLLRESESENFLLINMHHIITDGWSFSVLLNEVASVYNSIIKNSPHKLPRLTTQYFNFAAEECVTEKLLAREKALDYWVSKLRESHLLLNLPVDYPRGSISNYDSNFYTIEFTQDELKRIERFAGLNQATLFSVLFAAYSVILSRFSLQENVVIGLPVAGRDRAELENLVGFFVNTLPMRIDVDGSITFKEMVRIVVENLREAYSYQSVELEKVVSALCPERDKSYNPIFQTLFSFQYSGRKELKFGEFLHAEPYSYKKKSTELDLSLYASQRESGLTIRFEYKSAIFKIETIERVANSFKQFVLSGIENNTNCIGDIDIITQSDEKKLLDEFNSTESDLPEGKTIIDFFEQTVMESPDSPAVIFEKSELTYRDLNSKANQFANYLRDQKGIESGDIIAVFQPRSIELVICLLGIIKAGAAYLPIPTDFPEKRVRFILRDADCKLVVAFNKMPPPLNPQESECEILFYDQVLTDIGMSNKESPDINIIATDAPYVIYTSGSTGQPKGVANTHIGLLNRLLWMQELLALDQNDKVLQKTPYSFDVSVWEFFLPLMFGAQLVLARPEGHKDPVYLNHLVKSQKVTIMHFVPSMLSVFIEVVDVSELESLRAVICSGEALSTSLAERYVETHKHCKLYNFYGPTEAAIDVSYYECHQGMKHDVVSIGKPINNIKLYILDVNKKLAPIGVVGELYISGVGLASKYVNNQRLTADRFVRSPFESRNEYLRMYRTGDLAKYTADGNIEYHGRVDSQVKLRGLRIELGEIESVLNRMPGVRHAAVVVEAKNSVTQFLVAYISLQDGEIFNENRLRETCEKYLPEYMVPNYFLQIENMPMTTSGKLDRKKLPAVSSIEVTETIVPAKSRTEFVLQNIWQELLNVEVNNINANFFTLGGHSLLAIKCVAMIFDKLNVRISLSDFFEEPKILTLAKLVDNTADSERLDISAELEVNHAMPLSFSQSHFFDNYGENIQSTCFNLIDGLEIRNVVCFDKLRKALNFIAEANASLRTTFVRQAAQVRQKILPKISFEVEQFEFATEDEARGYILSEYNKSFDINEGPLFRFCFITFNKALHWLIFNRHSLISDCSSFVALANQLSAIYEKDATDQLSMKDLEIEPQYAQFGLAQHKWIEAGYLEKQLKFWQNELLSFSPYKQLPSDYLPKKLQSYQGETKRFTLDEGLTKKLLDISSNSNSTLFMLLVSAYQILLHNFTRQNELVTGFPVTYRTRGDLENVIGYFNNILFLKTRYSEDTSFVHFLKAVRDKILAAYSNKDIPYEYLEKLYSGRHGADAKVYNIHFSFRNLDTQVPLSSDFNLDVVDFPVTNAFQYLKMVCLYKDGKIECGINYNFELFKATTIDILMSSFEEICSKIANLPNICLKDLSLSK